MERKIDRTIKKFDIVRLKSGGPKMVVTFLVEKYVHNGGIEWTSSVEEVWVALATNATLATILVPVGALDVVAGGRPKRKKKTI